MKSKILRFFSLVAVLVVPVAWVAGCASAPSGSTAPTFADLKAVSQTMLNELYASGKLDEIADEFDDGKPIIGVGNIVDRSSCGIQTGVLTNAIIEQLLNGGHVRALSADKAARDRKRKERYLAGDPNYKLYPDLLLEGKIYEDHRRDPQTRTIQKTYSFQLALSKDAEQIWMKSVDIDKAREY